MELNVIAWLDDVATLMAGRDPRSCHGQSSNSWEATDRHETEGTGPAAALGRSAAALPAVERGGADGQGVGHRSEEPYQEHPGAHAAVEVAGRGLGARPLRQAPAQGRAQESRHRRRRGRPINKKLLQKVPGLNVCHAGSVAFTRLTRVIRPHNRPRLLPKRSAAAADRSGSPRGLGGAAAVRTAMAFWLSEPGVGELRSAPLPDPVPGEVLVRTLRSGISRGTETLVFSGGVPASQYTTMRAPFQDGEFPGPVKYGYLSVGVVDIGPPELLGRTVFCLHPHQTAYVVPAGAVVVVPEEVQPGRAVLAGTAETAINALWDAAPLLGDRISVVGAGMVGCCVARLLARFPGVQVTIVDSDARRKDVADAARRRIRAARGGGGRPRPRHPHQCDVAGPPAIAGVNRDGRHRHRAQLVRRRRDRRVAGRRVPLPPAGDQGQSRRHGVAGPPWPAHPRQPARARPRPAP